MKMVIGLIGLSCILSGCAGGTAGQTTKIIVNPSPIWPWDQKSDGVPLSDCRKTSCSDNDMFSAMLATGTYCRQVSNYYESGGNINSNTRLGVKVLGVLAGSVFGITAGGSAAKAWSGLSGATNGIQADLSDNVSARSNRARIVSKILADYNVEIKTLLGDKEPTLQVRRLIVWASMNTSNRCATEAEIEPENAAKKVEAQVAEIKKTIQDSKDSQQQQQQQQQQ
ncbi:hypothetical protein SAMN03159443_01916 [Pseudomonas sp. NFACC15-1]|uniref:hypothetical protein n=1 Tax=unclassified Pseudomonas TaxID=196821 RepID=UPI0008831DC8|nr:MULTISPECIES: hypothetical protein [unclassified Pseudomonas]SDA63497.1 hypothetical protein SAMN03159443_01916 [Pseudomonas sp. NFACC15-1]SDX91819.1 hypothetical protein SAMN03159380_03095 [Pseudomonas sp. NFACC14]